MPPHKYPSFDAFNFSIPQGAFYEKIETLFAPRVSRISTTRQQDNMRTQQTTCAFVCPKCGRETMEMNTSGDAKRTATMSLMKNRLHDKKCKGTLNLTRQQCDEKREALVRRYENIKIKKCDGVEQHLVWKNTLTFTA